MKAVYVKAFNALKRLGCPVFTNTDNERLGNFSISGEENDETTWAEYYAQSFGEFGVNQEVCDLLRSHGLHCEWENPAKLNVYVS